MKELKSLDKTVVLAILVAALGYFVDIYDLLLFSIVRVQSLKDLGIPEDQVLDQGVILMNAQMAGLLIGGILWGIIGDKKGRLSVLFGSIFMYSAANIANAFVTTVEMYAVLRFVAGVGLAGELGAGITLIAEILPQRLRGYGTSIVAGIGILGAVFGGIIAEFFHWTTAYLIGGVLGFLILLLRVGVRESGMFNKAKEQGVSRGNFMMVFRRRETFTKFVAVILIGVPIWFVIGILITFAPEFGRAFGMTEAVTAGRAVLWCYFGLALGDFSSGIVSQWFKSRKKAILVYIIGTAASVALHLLFAGTSAFVFYCFCVLIGFFAGYWAMFVTVAAEQFGTNLRSTVTTSVPNFVRGSVIPLTALFQYFKVGFGVIGGSAITGLIAFVIALVALFWLEETFHKDLDYNEV